MSTIVKLNVSDLKNISAGWYIGKYGNFKLTKNEKRYFKKNFPHLDLSALDFKNFTLLLRKLPKKQFRQTFPDLMD